MLSPECLCDWGGLPGFEATAAASPVSKQNQESIAGVPVFQNCRVWRGDGVAPGSSEREKLARPGPAVGDTEPLKWASKNEARR